jgi:hypothetical protein
MRFQRSRHGHAALVEGAEEMTSASEGAGLLAAVECAVPVTTPDGGRVRRYRIDRFDGSLMGVGSGPRLLTDRSVRRRSVRGIDFMPPRGHPPDIVRIVEGARR